MAHKRMKTIVCTIHQPSSEAFSYCDRLILMADGHVVYQGSGKESGSYFEMQVKGKNRNPCDYFMRELSINYPKKKADDEKIAFYLTRYKDE